MTQKWNLQDIKPATPRKKASSQTRPAPTERTTAAEVRDRKEARPKQKTKTGNSRKFPLLVVLLAVLIVGFGGLTFITKGADVTVHPRYREPNVNATFKAHKNAAAGELPYEIMSLEAEGERQVEATGEETVTEQAEGTIIIYNNHQTSPLRLVTNTRFESPDGLIFKIKDSVVVPGYSTNSSGEKVPGSITAEVYAEAAGDEYNIDPTRFTVPGFAGGPEFENVYAESVESFKGGFDGARFVLDEEELEVAKQALHTELRNSLLERVESEKPAGFIVFPGAVAFTYETLPAVAYDETLATIKEKVTLRVPLFADDEFAAFIAKGTVPGYEGGDVRLTDNEVIDFEYTSATTSASNIALDESLTFKLQGRPQIVWNYDHDSLKADLAGKNRTALKTVLSGYPAIESAEATIRPFWKKTFPDNPKEISITEVLE